MKEADWTPSPLVEGEAVARRRRLRRHDWVALSVGGTFLSVLAGFVVFASLDRLASDAAMAVIAVFLALAFGAAAAVDRRRAALVRQNAEADEALRAEFGEGSGWFVDLILLYGAAPIGKDRGMLWIEEERLVFSGHRTSFALSSDQVQRVRSEVPIEGLRHEIRLTLAQDCGPRAISLRPIAVPTWADDELGPNLVGWRSAGLSRGGQLPPCVPGPGAVPTSRLLVRASWSTLYWSALAFLALWVGGRDFGVLLFLFGICVGWLVRAWHPAMWWRAYLDRRRLEAG